MFYSKVFLYFIQIWFSIQYLMADNICDRIQSGNYKTIRLYDRRIQLFSGNNSYTFKEGDIKSAKMGVISEIPPFDLSPIQDCFVNNGKVYYIRGNKAFVFVLNGLNLSSFDWNPYNSNIDRLIIKKSEQILGFVVEPYSSNYGSGESSAQSDDIQAMAYGKGTSVSISMINGNVKIVYNGLNIPFEFNAMVANSDKSLTFFNRDKYRVVRRNSNSEYVWKDSKTLFGC